MGFLSNIYSKVKTFLPQVHGFGKKAAEHYKNAKNWVHETIEKASQIPFIGEALKKGANTLYEKQINVPVVGNMSIKEIQNYLEEFGSAFSDDANVSHIANQIDSYVQPLVDKADRYISGADRAASTNPYAGDSKSIAVM